MSVKTWDLLDRKTGHVLGMTGVTYVSDDPLTGMSARWDSGGYTVVALPLSDREVAYCRETGEVVYR